MKGQISILDLHGKPDYRGSRDEIIRHDIEAKFERSITLHDCDCGETPKEMFKSCHDYYVVCPVCGKKTKTYRHMYEAMQAWNRDILEFLY